VKQLSDILYKVPIKAVSGPTDVAVTDIQIDSRKVQQGCVFVAVKGSASDGHDYIKKAIASGAIAVVGEMPFTPKQGITYIQVSDSAEAAGVMAHHFYDQPSHQLKLVGVTGTNGKTTIATLLYKLFTGLGYTCGLGQHRRKYYCWKYYSFHTYYTRCRQPECFTEADVRCRLPVCIYGGEFPCSASAPYCWIAF
jgi:hypothetical protein